MKKRLASGCSVFVLLIWAGAEGGVQGVRLDRQHTLFPPGVMRKEVGWDFPPKPWQPMCEPNGDT